MRVTGSIFCLDRFARPFLDWDRIDLHEGGLLIRYRPERRRWDPAHVVATAWRQFDRRFRRHGRGGTARLNFRKMET